MEKLPKINIIYEDNHLLIVEKPINIPVCADNSKDLDLLNILKDYLKTKYNKPGDAYLGLVHRLDRPVGGLMVFAKTSKAASRLSKDILEKRFIKTYYAVVENPICNTGVLEDYLIKDTSKNIVRTTTKDKGKYAKLSFTKVKYKNNLSLIKINLETGRSHQIRVQFSSRNNPLVGDQKYNINSQKNTNIALFAKNLEFFHPVTKEKLLFELPLPKRYPFNLF